MGFFPTFLLPKTLTTKMKMTPSSNSLYSVSTLILKHIITDISFKAKVDFNSIDHYHVNCIQITLKFFILKNSMAQTDNTLTLT